MAMSPIPPPDVRVVIAPLLSALPAAATSTTPDPSLLPLLSPILRQRVQVLSGPSSKEPWLRYLTYEPKHVETLSNIALTKLEPHPVSGELEVDDFWSHFKRLDRETFQALLAFNQYDLYFRLVYCPSDATGGWRVGEVGVPAPEPSHPGDPTAFGGFPTIDLAEAAFASTLNKSSTTRPSDSPSSNQPTTTKPLYDPIAAEDGQDGGDEDDDDGYWDRYDATPARTPAVKRSPAPQSMQQQARPGAYNSTSAEDAYFAQYDSVQPAMDNHDPDEAASLPSDLAPPPLGLKPASTTASSSNATPPEIADLASGWTLAEPPEEESRMLHPRPASSAASSNGSLSVARLEEAAEKRDQSEFGVKQHVSRSIRSLFLLSRASGIDREEFERMVRTELDVLGLVEGDI